PPDGEHHGGGVLASGKQRDQIQRGRVRCVDRRPRANRRRGNVNPFPVRRPGQLQLRIRAHANTSIATIRFMSSGFVDPPPAGTEYAPVPSRYFVASFGSCGASPCADVETFSVVMSVGAAKVSSAIA